MNIEAYNVHKAIGNHPVAKRIMNGAINEHPMIKEVQIGRHTIEAKGMFDIYNKQLNVIADIKTTSAKTINTFGEDMLKHYNHIQAAWFAKVAGVDPSSFYYIGVPARAKQDSSTENDIFVCRHSDHDLQQANFLIEDYIRKEWDTVKNSFAK